MVRTQDSSDKQGNIYIICVNISTAIVTDFLSTLARNSLIVDVNISKEMVTEWV